jgi:2-oxoglutarate ferredoxin oxidoreductase subunit alpha
MDVSIVLSGEAGQGIKTVELFINEALRDAGYHFFSTSEVMSRIRGGNNTTEIRIGGRHIQGFADKIDILVVLHQNGIYRIEDRIDKNTIIIGDPSSIEDEYKNKYNVKECPVNQIAKDNGGKIMANTVVFGLIIGILRLNTDEAKGLLKKRFGKKGDEVVNNNIAALEAGYEEGNKIEFEAGLETFDDVKEEVVVTGGQTIGIGAIAGGCNFISSYPMSPSTSVLLFLAKHAEKFGVVAEQAEDEIAAINMALGSWYAGGRGMATTSGGGFALMEEGISLSGITEIPAVIHLAQRPGPGTGLPTRTEQGDLTLALYAGHGDFPRIILAPGHPEEGIELTQKAFNLADKFKVPVIVLTDQFYLDSHYLMPKVDVTQYKNEYHIEKTKKDYKTYKLTESGMSPRGVPGYGEGYVCVDSDEHDEWGRITEDTEVRVNMVDKRLNKQKAIEKEAIEPELIGPKNYKILVIGWGSNYGVINEALHQINSDKIAFAHFKQLFPLPGNTKELIEKAEKTIMVENNATSQFSQLIKVQTGLDIDEKILQYNGMPFSVETLIKKIGG